MDVLNTTGGVFVTETVIEAVIFGVYAMIAYALSIMFARDKEYGRSFVTGVMGILATVLTVYYVLTCVEPIRHEVTLRPGYVIDATKYEIVGHRGKIYVIEEREASE